MEAPGTLSHSLAGSGELMSENTLAFSLIDDLVNTKKLPAHEAADIKVRCWPASQYDS